MKSDEQILAMLHDPKTTNFEEVHDRIMGLLRNDAVFRETVESIGRFKFSGQMSYARMGLAIYAARMLDASHREKFPLVSIADLLPPSA